jgi:hypothetical protein
VQLWLWPWTQICGICTQIYRSRCSFGFGFGHKFVASMHKSTDHCAALALALGTNLWHIYTNLQITMQLWLWLWAQICGICTQIYRSRCSFGFGFGHKFVASMHKSTDHCAALALALGTNLWHLCTNLLITVQLWLWLWAQICGVYTKNILITVQLSTDH